MRDYRRWNDLRSEPSSRRFTLVHALSALVIAPVIAASLLGAPDVAFAATDNQAKSVDKGTIVLCDDPFSVDSGTSKESASNAPETNSASVPAVVAEAPQESAPPPGPAAATAGASDVIAPAPQVGGDASPSDAARGGEPLGEAATPTESEDQGSTGAGEPESAKQPEPSGLSAQESSEARSSADGIELYESHEADLTFVAGEGGSVAAGDAASEGLPSVSEHYSDSLKGTSKGATAIAKAGYHFAYWLDTLYGQVVSENVSFVPYRPDGGWPESWTFQAVFAPDVYEIVLDPNGGTAGGGGGSSGDAVRLQVPVGTDYKIPSNGSDAVAYTKPGSTLTGWNVVAFPMLKSATGSLPLSDGQVLDSATEGKLVREGHLKLDWSKGRVPSITFYAQWEAGTATISYIASDGGAIALLSNSDASGSSKAAESFDALSGAHANDTAIIGPAGAIASADAHYHFTGWQLSGSSMSMTAAEASKPRLDSSTVKRLTFYAVNGSDIADYHSASFTASFSPNTYTFKYSPNNGAGSVSSQSLSYGGTIKTASSGYWRDGYKLDGWNTAADGSGTSVALGATVDSATVNSLISDKQLADSDGASTTLYAQWSYVGNPYTPTPSRPSTPSKPSNNDDGDEGQGAGSDTDGSSPSQAADYTDSTWAAAVAPNAAADVVDTAATIAKNAQATAQKETPGLLASDKSSGSGSGVVAYGATSDGYSNAGGEGEGFFNQLMSPEGMRETGTTVAAVAAVGALMGLVGVGMSVAGAAIVGAATIGTAGAVGLTTAVDLAADLAAAGAGAGAGSAAKRRKEDEDEDEEPQREEEA